MPDTRLIIYPSYYDTHSAVLDEIEERILDRMFTHYASQLLGQGLDDEMELEEALQKAMTALRAAHLPAYRHFKRVFRCYNDRIGMDWLVSELGFRLIIMHSDASNPLMAKLQIELLT